MRKPWSRSEKLLWMTPILFGVIAVIVYVGTKYGPGALRQSRGLPTGWLLATGTDVRSMALSRDGSILAAAGRNEGKNWQGESGKIHLWDARTAKSLPPIAPLHRKDERGYVTGREVYGLALSPDAGKIGFSRLGQNWESYDLKSRKPLWKFDQFCPIASYSPDGNYIALNYADRSASTNSARTTGIISIVKAQNGIEVTEWKRSGGSDRHLSWSPNGNILAACSIDAVELRDPQNGKLLRSLNCPDVITANFSPDGSTLICASSLDSWSNDDDLTVVKPLRCFEVATGKLLWEVAAPKFQIREISRGARLNAAIFSPDGKQIAVYQDTEERVILLDSNTREFVRILPISKLQSTQMLFPNSLAFSPDGNRIYARGKDSIWVWDLKQ